MNETFPLLNKGRASRSILAVGIFLVLSTLLVALVHSYQRKELFSIAVSADTTSSEPVTVSKIYEPYHSEGKWSWDDYSGDGTSSSYGPSFHIRPSAPAPLGRRYQPAIVVQPPAADDTDNNLYDSWTGGWRTEN